MRIGVDARELQGRPTGTGRYLRNLLGAWPKGDALVLYFNGPAPENAFLRDLGARQHSVGSGGRGLVWMERLLPEAAREDGLDAFFAPSYFCPQRLAVPRVTTLHDLSFFSHPHDFAPWEAARRRFLVSAAVGVSSRVVAVSEFTAREIAAVFPAAAGRVVTIHEAADEDLPWAPSRDEARRALQIDGRLVLSVGSILNRRCLPSLLAAMRLLARRVPDVVLDVVGDNRTHPRLDVPALVRDLALDRHVRLSGFVSDVELAARYAAADAAVYLSEYEGFGLPVLEAMSRGLPVLTSRRPATGELFAEAALLAEPDDPAEIADGLYHMLCDPAQRDDLARRGRAKAATFSWRTAAERTRAALAEAAGA
jgi:glycosyltransferase involved in cell wall biosynthesis